MNLQRNHVAIEPEPIPVKTTGGLIVTTNTNQRTGVVKAVGSECDMVEVGQKVMYLSRRAIEQDNVHIVNESDDILAIL